MENEKKEVSWPVVGDLYKTGFSMCYIAKQFGVTVPTIKKYLLAHGYKIRSRQEYWNKSLPSSIVERYKKGEITISYISKLFGKHKSTICRRLRRILNTNNLRTIKF